MKPQVLVVGSYMQDLVWNTATFPRPGETVVGRSFFTGPGGKGSNQAVACGRTGTPTLFVGAVGRDPFAAAARAFYRAEGIGARLVEKQRHATGTAAILVAADGQNEIVVALGANAFLVPRDVPAAVLQSARVVVTQLEARLATSAHVLRAARRSGALTVLNTAPMRPDFDPTILRHTDIVIPNEPEFIALAQRLELAPGGAAFNEAALAALAPAELHALCRRLGPPVVVLTLGARGCLVSQQSGYTALPAHAVNVIDTTGAGDAFVGGFAAGLVRHGGDPVAAARLGNAVAALSVTKPGTAPAMPKASEIARFLRRQQRSAA
jgi:ribokinase